MTDSTPPVDAHRGDGECNPLFRAALDAAGRGWRVFPLQPEAKRPALHGEAACPHTGPCAAGHAKWEQRATDDPELIEHAWHGAWYNVGIATGPSGLLVVDLDQPKNNSKKDMPCGMTTFTALCERAGQQVPHTYTVRTPSGGWHLYFTAPEGVRLSNTAGTLGPLIDTRAWGGYVVAAGSTISGGLYVDNGARLAPLPDWLYNALRPAPRRRETAGAASPGATTRAARYAQTALSNETRAVAATGEGGRDTALLRAARALGRFIAWGDLPRHVVEEALQEAGEAAGLPPSQCRSTIRSALNWSIRNNPQRRTA